MLLIPFDLDGNQHAILAFVFVWWLDEAIPIPVTALLGVVLRALLEATPPPPEGDSTSPVMSNTAGAATMLPIVLGVMGVVGGMVANQAGGQLNPERLRFGAALMLVITYCITAGGLLVPIGSPPNLIGREPLESETGEPVTFFEWFVMALRSSS